MKRIRLISIVAVVIVFGGLAVAIFRAREPRYEGRTLTQWIKDGESAYEQFINNPNVDPLHPEIDPAWRAANHALKHMSPEAIPLLLKWVQMKDSPSTSRTIAWLDNNLSFDLIGPALNRRLIAVAGFRLLGSEARPAWPALIQLTQSTAHQVRLTAFFCLTETKPDKETLVPVLLRLIHDPNVGIQFAVSHEFFDRYPQDAEAAGVKEIFSALEKLRTSQPSTNQTIGK
jgi:hypothetical protein